MSQYMEDSQMADLLQELLDLSFFHWMAPRHGSVLTFSSLLRQNPSSIFMSLVFSSIVDRLKISLKDEKVPLLRRRIMQIYEFVFANLRLSCKKLPLLEASTRALGRLLIHQVRSDPSNTTAVVILSTLVAALYDDSSEVRRRALSALKAVAKANPSAIVAHVTIYGPALAECLKDGSTPVRLAAERCALHALQLSKGAEYVQAAQKFITGLDARRLSKFPEHSDDSEDSEDD